MSSFLARLLGSRGTTMPGGKPEFESLGWADRHMHGGSTDTNHSALSLSPHRIEDNGLKALHSSNVVTTQQMCGRIPICPRNSPVAGFIGPSLLSTESRGRLPSIVSSP